VTRLSVREAHPGELDDAGRIVADAYVAGGGFDIHDRRYLDQIRDARRRARSCPVLVAVEDGTARLLGSVTYVPSADNPFAEVEVDGEAGFRMLGVAPEAQGCGVGRALVLACIERARADGRRALAISTGPDMAAARRLYEGLGFRRAEERDFDPVPGVHLLAYVLQL
jgi:ribosomal protein S18 acetylase RimI-like enzyme